MKRSIKQNLARVGVAVVATAAAVVAVPSVAQAAGYNGVCGSGYRVVDSMPLAGGTAFLTYNSSTGQNCAVTVRNSTGSPVYVLASIRVAVGEAPGTRTATTTAPTPDRSTCTHRASASTGLPRSTTTRHSSSIPTAAEVVEVRRHRSF